MNSINPHGGLFEGRGLIIKISFDMGAYSRGGINRWDGAKSRTYGKSKMIFEKMSKLMSNLLMRTCIRGDAMGSAGTAV